MRLIFLILFSFSFLALNAQDKVIVKYYDTLWKPVTKEKAKYYTQFEYKDGAYQGHSYYLTSNNICEKFTSLDTNRGSFVLRKISYYESGIKKDSAYTHMLLT